MNKNISSFICVLFLVPRKNIIYCLYHERAYNIVENAYK